jgi:hypothetical protein
MNEASNFLLTHSDPEHDPMCFKSSITSGQSVYVEQVISSRGMDVQVYCPEPDSDDNVYTVVSPREAQVSPTGRVRLMTRC